MRSGMWCREVLAGSVRSLEATLQAAASFLKVSFDKAKVFIKPGTPAGSSVVAVETR